jgi:hypothetical protein
LIELCVKTINPCKLVEEFMSIFHERLAQGDLCRMRTIKMLYVTWIGGSREGGRIRS